MSGRELPNNLQAEFGILACCLIDGAETIVRCIEAKLLPEAFYSPANRIVFETLLAMYERRSAIDALLLCNELRDRGELTAIGGESAVESLANFIETTAHIAQFIAIVQEKHARRRIITAAVAAVEKCYEETTTPALQLASEFSQTLAEVADASVQPVEPIAQVAARVASEVKAEIEGKLQRGTIEMGFPGIDRRLGKLASHELVLVAGRPGSGKTSLVLGTAALNAAKGHTVLLFSLEMMADELIRIIAGQACMIPARGVAELPADKQREFLNSIALVGKINTLKIFDRETGIDGIVARCRRERMRGKVGLIVIDYCQLIDPSRATAEETRERQIASISRTLKLLPREIGAPVLLNAQLNRRSESEDRPPRKSDLRESGSLEQDADRVYLLYCPPKGRDGADQADDAPLVHVRMIVDKHRSGPTGAAWLAFQRPTQTFHEMTKD